VEEITAAGMEEVAEEGPTKYYEVIYDPNYPTSSDTSGKAPVDNKNYRYNEIVNVRGNTDGLKAGDYVFKGWNTKPDGTGTMYLQGNMFNIKEDTILYAIWELAEADPDMATTDASTDTVVTQAKAMIWMTFRRRETQLQFF
jgi:hypothetical protein